MAQYFNFAMSLLKMRFVLFGFSVSFYSILIFIFLASIVFMFIGRLLK